MEHPAHVGIDRLLEILRATGKKYDLEKIQAAYDYAAGLHPSLAPTRRVARVFRPTLKHFRHLAYMAQRQ